jgi:hypothetical protein
MSGEVAFRDLSALVGDEEALKQQVEQDGFGLFRGLIPQAPILELRRLILENFRCRGWIREGTRVMEGIIDPAIHEVECYASNGVDKRAYQDVYRMQEFHRLAHHPAIIALFARLFGDQVFVHPRNIARLMAPHRDAQPTAPHQDFIYVQGSHATYTCWFPLGDCPRELGGLALVPGSHRREILQVRDAEGAGGRTVIIDDDAQIWAQGDLRCGDVVIFHSKTIHKTFPNRTENRIRLSVDFRYQPLSVPVDNSSLLPHVGLLTWEETYAGWGDSDLRYYWKDLDLEVSDFDWSLLDTSKAQASS